MLNIGEYTFSTFIAKINVDFDLNNFNNWEPIQKATVFHEFFHFYQNCSTVYGQICISQICNIVATIHNEKKDIINLPYSSNDLLISQSLFDIYYKPTQNWKNINLILDQGIKSSIKLNELINNSENQKLKNKKFEYAYLSVINKDKERTEYILDGIAICETMIAMIEEELFPRTTRYRSEYPYCLANEISNKIRLNIKWSNKILILICDLCLDFYNPGVIFINFFYTINENKTTITINEIFEYFSNIIPNIYIQSQDQFKSFNFYEYKSNTKNQAIQDLKNLITNHYYDSSYTWIKEGINSMYIIRNQRLYLQKEKNQLLDYNLDWFISILNLGYPIFKLCNNNEEKDIFFKFGNTCKNEQIQWQYWFGVNSFLKLLEIDNFDSMICPFNSYCENSDNEVCSLNPFQFYKKGNCQFQHFMSVFNLENKKIIDSKNK